MTPVVTEAHSVRALPSRTGAAARVLMVVDDPEAGVADVATAVGADPALASKTMALANSSYYGLSGRVGTLHYAISVLGFQTVRALAVSIAAGLDKAGAVPPGFWEQAATSATAGTLIAPFVGASAPDAFCAGLLHTLGSALLHQEHPLPALCLPYPDDDEQFAEAELALYGIGHAEIGAQVLATWSFPDALCSLIAGHHDVPLPDATPLARALHAARTLTDLALNDAGDGFRARSTLSRLSDGKLEGDQVAPMVALIREKSQLLLSGLQLG